MAKTAAAVVTDDLSFDVTPALRSWLVANKWAQSVAADVVMRQAARTAAMAGSLTEEKFIELCSEEDDDMDGKKTTGTKDAKAEKIFGGGDGSSNPRVKSAIERYSDRRPAAKHVKTGLPVFNEFGEECSRPSQKSLALTGCYIKALARRRGVEQVVWNDHDEQLFNELVNDHEFVSFAGTDKHEKRFAPGALKAALLSDSNSGGAEANPVVFDSDFVSEMLLTGELLPTVNIVPISRGAQVESGKVGAITAQWAQGDATAGTLFDATGLITELNTSIYDLSAHVNIGRNLMADSPLNIANIVMNQITERMLNEVEKVIAVGTGSQPQGVMNASGTTAVAFSSAAITASKVLSLLFSVPKELRGPSFAFASNEVTYRRLRSLATGVSGDERLLFGMDVESYRVLDRPWKICHHMANTQILGGAMKDYRLYRRQGTATDITTAGDYLQTRNLMLLSVRQRWGGRVVRPASFGVVSDAQA